MPKCTCCESRQERTTVTTSASQTSFMPPAKPYGSGGLLVFDTSAWNRQRDQAVLSRWIATAEADVLAVCPVVALELLASARDEQNFANLDRTLMALPAAPVTRSAGAAALGASRELRGERRIPAADYLIAAAAAGRGAGVLHYDRHFDPLCRALGIESIWIAPPGSID
jgi:predicted nucleic acid-binding protein